LARLPLPAELKNERDADQLISNEHALMQARADLLSSQLSGLKDVKELYEQEVQSLADKTKSLQRQIVVQSRSREQHGSRVNG